MFDMLENVDGPNFLLYSKSIQIKITYISNAANLFVSFFSNQIIYVLQLK